MGKGDVEEETLHYYHHAGLDEEGGVVVGTEPVEEF